MPAKHGHDGKNTLPGFTGISGDLDGDGKNESNAACDPSAELPHGEDKDGTVIPACLQPSWVRPRFDLSSLAGKDALVRLRYYTDGAAVMRGILIDNVSISGRAGQGDRCVSSEKHHIASDGSVLSSGCEAKRSRNLELNSFNTRFLGSSGDFESSEATGWTLDGFSRSSGSHDLLVPHFYLVEYRDPYAPELQGAHRYDSALAKSSPLFYADPSSGEMRAVRVRSRPGVVIWYYNGAYAWSENDPSINGPGQGYLLVVDSNTEELRLPGLDPWYKGSSASNDTHYEVSGDDAQAALKKAYRQTVCFVRNPAYLPQDGITRSERKRCQRSEARVGRIRFDGKPLQYSYQVYNERLPGADRAKVSKTGELIDTRTRKGVLSYRLRDRSLRALHTRDAPFAAEPFERAIIDYNVRKNALEEVAVRESAAVSTFSDKTPGNYLNTKLGFGGVRLPSNGLSIEIMPRANDAEGNTQVKVHISWK